MTFYLDNPDELDYKPNKTFTQDEYEDFVEEIKMCLNTSGGEVMGASSMDGDIESYVFKKDVNENDVSKKILFSISNYSELSRKFVYSVRAFFTKNLGKETCFIDIKIAKIEIPDVIRRVKILI